MADRSPQPPSSAGDPVRERRLRADARRPMSVNLAETIALSHALHRVAATRRPS